MTPAPTTAQIEAAARVLAAGGWDAPNEGADCEPDDEDRAIARRLLIAAAHAKGQQP